MTTRADDQLEWAWTIIANASGGDWTKESPEWQHAAANWRDQVMPSLSTRSAERARLASVATSGPPVIDHGEGEE